MTAVSLEDHLRAARAEGRKLLVPYVTGWLDDEWVDLVRGFADAGADAIEIGIPFSYPVMDGPVIQEASEKALLAGCLVLVLSGELLNSAIEAIVDKASPEFHELAGRAKDMGSAAVLLLMANAVMCWGLVLLWT